MLYCSVTKHYKIPLKNRTMLQSTGTKGLSDYGKDLKFIGESKNGVYWYYLVLNLILFQWECNKKKKTLRKSMTRSKKKKVPFEG